MVEISYECDKDGIIQGIVSNGSRVILFSVSADTIMHGKDKGLYLLDEIIMAAIKELTDHPEAPELKDAR
jgi:hypothetical protein